MDTLIALALSLAQFFAGSGADPVSLTFVGDIMLGRAVERSVVRQAGGDFSWLFASTTELADSDILFGNLEGPLSDQGTEMGNLYSFRFLPAAAPALAAAGFDILSLANNHIGDWGTAAALDSTTQLERVGIVSVGVEGDREEERLRVIERRGRRVGFLAFSDVGPAWITVADQELGETISRAAGQVDALVVSYHWGDEYQPHSNARQQYLARLAIDNGALLVIGHHPHVAQEFERYGRGLIAYSLGNFIFDQNFSVETMKGLALEVEIDQDGIARARARETPLTPEYRPTLGKVIYEY